MKKNIKVTLNGKTVYGYEGQRILDLCSECGMEIPTLCYDPHLSLHGGCSVCLVEVEGAKHCSGRAPTRSPTVWSSGPRRSGP